MAAPQTNLTYRFSEVTNNDLLQMIDPERDIPEHQRPEMWNERHQVQLIDTVMSGLPMVSILIREEVQQSALKRWLEDGHQRFISIWKFYNNKIKWNNRSYSDFTVVEQLRFLSYKVPVLFYQNATPQETIQIFDYFQNGIPLTPGQRFHARLDTPLVRYARSRLLTPGQHFYDRASAVWGAHPHNQDTKTKKWLMNAIALCAGAAHGVTYIVKSYEIIGPKLMDEINYERADMFLDALIRTFELADGRLPIRPKEQKKIWNDIAGLCAYVLASYITYPDQIADLQRGWVDYIVSDRENGDNLKQLHHNAPPSRNMTPARWRIGYENVFVNPPDDDAMEANNDDGSEDE